MRYTRLAIASVMSLTLSAFAQAPNEAFFNVTSADNQTQGMAMALANLMVEQKATVRVLLCGPAGQLALKTYEPAALKPKNLTPKQMLGGLMKSGATVEVCALFLPNAERASTDLTEGVTVAKPPEIAAFMLKPGVKVFGF